jgi:O-antigen/teichoic acid export membrane protein
MLTAIARFGTPEMVGKFALGLALTAPVVMFSNLQLRAVIATDARRDFYFRDYLSLRYISTALALFVIVGIALFGGYQKETKAVIIFIGLAKSFEALSDIFYGLLQRDERMDSIAKRIILKGILGLVLLCAFLLISRDIVIGIGGLLVAYTITFFGYDIRGRPQVLDDPTPGRVRVIPLGPIRGRWEIHKLANLAWTAFPLGIVMMLLSLNTNVPRYFLERSMGEHDLGIFAAIAYLSVAGTTITSALGQSAIPRLANHYEKREIRAYKNLIAKMIVIGAVMGILAIALASLGGRIILTTIDGPEYALHSDLLVLIMIAGSMQFIASFLGYGMTAARRFRAQLPLFLVITATSIIMSYLLIPLYGLKGAAYALLISSVVQVIGSLIILMKALDIAEN